MSKIKIKLYPYPQNHNKLYLSLWGLSPWRFCTLTLLPTALSFPFHHGGGEQITAPPSSSKTHFGVSVSNSFLYTYKSNKNKNNVRSKYYNKSKLNPIRQWGESKWPAFLTSLLSKGLSKWLILLLTCPIYSLTKSFRRVKFGGVIQYFAKLRSSWQVQYQSNWELKLVLILVWHPPTPPHPIRASIFEPFLDYIRGWNLIWKLYSTKQGQLAN